MMRERYRSLPLPLQRQVVRHSLLGCALVILTLAIAVVEKDIALTVLGLMLGALFVVYAAYLVCIDFVAVEGVCTAVERSMLFRKTVTVIMQTDSHTLRIPVRRPQGKVREGVGLILYLNSQARVYEDNGVLMVYEYRLLVPSESISSM